MRSYSIALLFHARRVDESICRQLAAYRETLPFASIYLYSPVLDDAIRQALQKLDVILRRDPCDQPFKLVRRMFTETDADMFAYIGQAHYSAKTTAAMIHDLVEQRRDVVIASTAPRDGEHTYQHMCIGLYGVKLTSPLSDFRVFSRRFVKSFAAFERGLPIELEWSIHTLELDIPYSEYSLQDNTQPDNALMAASGHAPASLRQKITRLILNLQARPLKWFGLATAANGLAMLFYKALFCLNYFGYGTFIDGTQSALGAGIFAVLTFLSALSGLALHSISHQRRELKRLHFQQHSTL